MTDQELKDLVASLAIDRKESEKRSKEVDKQLKELGQQIGGIANLLAVLPKGWLCLP